MKFMVISALAFVSSLAHAETLRTCILTTQSKSQSAPAVSRTVYLASGRMNYVAASETTNLKIMLAHVGANADVYVNDQLQFIFKGDVTKGAFESAMDKGTLACDQGREVGAIYQNVPGGVTTPVKDESVLASCYGGNPAAVAKDLEKVAGFSASSITLSKTTGTVSASRTEKQCIEGSGTNPDDYVCRKSGNVKVTYQIKNCDYDPSERP